MFLESFTLAIYLRFICDLFSDLFAICLRFICDLFEVVGCSDLFAIFLRFICDLFSDLFAIFLSSDFSAIYLFQEFGCVRLQKFWNSRLCNIGCSFLVSRPWPWQFVLPPSVFALVSRGNSPRVHMLYLPCFALGFPSSRVCNICCSSYSPSVFVTYFSFPLFGFGNSSFRLFCNRL